MMVRKFYADSAREALRLVRDALGPNAMILSNRRTAAGVEIAAVPESEIASVTAGMAMHAMTAPKPERRPAEVNERAPVAPPPTPPSTAEPAAYNLVQEVRILRSMLEGQLAAFAWHGMADREPAKIEVLRRLLAAGFSTGSARQCVERIAPGFD